jgi:hypothetical protein
MPEKVSPSASPSSLLLDPINREIAEALNAGTTDALPDKVALKMGWSPPQLQVIRSQLISWLKNNKQTDLVEFLSHEPAAILHPCVFWQLFHLRSLLWQFDEDDVKAFEEHGGSHDNDQPVLPSGIKPLAEEFLLKLLSAWVSGMLPDHVVTRLKPFKRRGRTAKWSTDDRITILTEFGDLSKALNEIEEAGPAEVALKKNESRAKFLKRMEAVVQRLNTRTLEYMFASIETPATMTKRAVLKKQRPSLPNTVASRIVRQAVPDTRLSKNNLLYGILAHHYLRDCRKIEPMRGLIEHGEADFSDLDTRGHSHSSKS